MIPLVSKLKYPPFEPFFTHFSIDKMSAVTVAITHSSIPNFRSEKRFKTDITVAELKQKARLFRIRFTLFTYLFTVARASCWHCPFLSEITTC